ncbi:MAG: hypothetical protein WHX52_19595 [Anaerolineae bacterium]
MTEVSTMTLAQVLDTGYRALLRELGTVNFIRFLQQFETGSGDYTLERHQWLDQYTLDDLVQEIQSQRVETGRRNKQNDSKD